MSSTAPVRAALVAAAFSLSLAAATIPDYVVSRIAGGRLPATSMVATADAITPSTAVAVDRGGNVYFAAQVGLTGGLVFRIDPQGILTRVAGNGVRANAISGNVATDSPLGFVQGLATDASGNVYITDGSAWQVFKVGRDGILTLAAGAAPGTGSPDALSAINAALIGPAGLTVDSLGNLYIAETGAHRVRKVNTAGAISTVAGNGTQGYAGDGLPGTAAMLGSPMALTIDRSGNLYIADAAGYVRVVDAAGTISTRAGNGMQTSSGDGGAAAAAGLLYPSGITIDPAGTIYISTFGGCRRIVNGIIDTVARLSWPAVSIKDIAADSAGNLYAADALLSSVVKADAGTWAVTTLAGGGFSPGPAPFTTTLTPDGIARDSAGNLYFSVAHTVRKISPDGSVSIFAGTGVRGYSGDGGPAAAAQLSGPAGLAFDANGNLLIADEWNHRVRKVTPDGHISTFAGIGAEGFSGDGGPAAAAMLDTPSDVAVDPSGNVLILDFHNGRVRSVGVDGRITTIAGNGSHQYSGDNGPATSGGFVSPTAMAVDAAGAVYLADTGDYRVRKVFHGTITTAAGNGVANVSADGFLAPTGGLGQPLGVALDAAGNLLIATGAGVRIVNSAGIVTTIAGNASGSAPFDGAPAKSVYLVPQKILAAPDGSVYFVDAYGAGLVQLTVVGGPPALHAQVTHSGTVKAGQNTSYNIVVSNAAQAGPSSGNVNVTEILPPGFSIQSMSGTGWDCAAGACSRTNSLPAGAAYPAIAVVVAVPSNAPAQLTNRVTVSGGGSPMTGASDFAWIAPSVPTLLSPPDGATGVTLPVTLTWQSPAGQFFDVYFGPTLPNSPTATTTAPTADAIPTAANTAYSWKVTASNPAGSATSAVARFTTGQPAVVLAVTKSHSGNFVQGLSGTYSIVIRNTGVQPTSGAITLTENVPAGLSLTSLTGSGWTCALTPGTCSRGDALSAGASYPAITVTVAVAANAPAALVNQVSVSGGGAAAVVATDPTTIVPPTAVTIATSPVGMPITVDGASYSAPRTFSWAPGTSHTVTAYPSVSLVARYIFANWSDSGDQTHSIVTPSAAAATYTANFSTQYPVLAMARPSNAGAVTLTPASSDGYYDAGATVQITATPVPGYLLDSFTGAATGNANPLSFVVSSASTEVALFVPSTAPPSVNSVTPNSGAGAVQTFAATFDSQWGASDIRWVQLLFAVASDGGGQSFCFVHYDARGNGLWLYGDGGFFVGPVTPGTASNRLQNSLCAVNTSASSATTAGTTLTLNASVVFKSAGAKNIYGRAMNVRGNDSDWQSRGTWNPAAASQPALSVSPSSGSGSTQTFTLTYPDPPGFAGAAFGWTQFLVAAASDGGGQPFCFVHYDRGGNALWMYSSDVGFFLGPVAPGIASNALSSSACSVDTAAATVNNSGGNLVVAVPITMKSPMSGAKKIYQRTLDTLNRDTGWQQTGTWTVQ